jgi:hypothetical protein
MQLVAEYHKVIKNSHTVRICGVSNRLSFGPPEQYPEDFYAMSI